MPFATHPGRSLDIATSRMWQEAYKMEKKQQLIELEPMHYEYFLNNFIKAFPNTMN
jgi:hypothetical protein